MAAHQQSRRKAREAKRKKAQKKHQQARRKQKKLQPQKQKKPRQARPKHKGRQSKAGGSGGEQERKVCRPRLFASRILRQMPKVRMEAKARNLVKTMLTDVYNHVATEVETLSQKNEASAISSSDVQTALKEAMSKELAKHTAEPPTSGECA
nr:histone H2B.5-like [Pogona vitticeps]XP_020665776.1 histone H2B.5-like [Pogona vitticeps]